MADRKTRLLFVQFLEEEEDSLLSIWVKLHKRMIPVLRDMVDEAFESKSGFSDSFGGWSALQKGGIRYRRKAIKDGSYKRGKSKESVSVIATDEINDQNILSGMTKEAVKDAIYYDREQNDVVFPDIENYLEIIDAESAFILRRLRDNNQFSLPIDSSDVVDLVEAEMDIMPQFIEMALDLWEEYKENNI